MKNNLFIYFFSVLLFSILSILTGCLKESENIQNNHRNEIIIKETNKMIEKKDAQHGQNENIIFTENQEDVDLDMIVNELINDKSTTLEAWLFPPEILTELPVTIDNMKNKDYSEVSYIKINDSNKIGSLLNFLRDQYKISSPSSVESSEQDFLYSRAWLEFYSKSKNIRLIVNLNNLEWTSPNILIQLKVYSENINYLYQIREIDSYALRPRISELESKAK